MNVLYIAPQESPLSWLQDAFERHLLGWALTVPETSSNSARVKVLLPDRKYIDPTAFPSLELHFEKCDVFDPFRAARLVELHCRDADIVHIFNPNSQFGEVALLCAECLNVEVVVTDYGSYTSKLSNRGNTNRLTKYHIKPRDFSPEPFLFSEPIAKVKTYTVGIHPLKPYMVVGSEKTARSQTPGFLILRFNPEAIDRGLVSAVGAGTTPLFFVDQTFDLDSLQYLPPALRHRSQIVSFANARELFAFYSSSVATVIDCGDSTSNSRSIRAAAQSIFVAEIAQSNSKMISLSSEGSDQSLPITAGRGDENLYGIYKIVLER